MNKRKIFITLIVIVFVVNMISCCIYKSNATDVQNAESLQVSYRTHVQNEGWQEYVNNGETSGSTGKGLRLEGINIKLLNNNSNINIKYQVHIQDIGWQDWKSNDEMSGTSGQALRLEAIKIALENTENYGIKYRVHVENIGWQDWKYDGELAGTSGQSLRLEAIEIKLIEKPHVQYSGHVQDIGWQSNVQDGATAGTTGKALRVEGLKIQLTNVDDTEHIKYKTHVENIGWQNWKKDGEIAGTTGQSLRIEAIQIQTEGLGNYKVQYRTHVQDIGWQNWVDEGQIAGTTGQAKRIEALEIRIVKKSSTTNNEPTTPSSRFNVNSIDTSKYPGYKEKIASLMAAHPSWDFKLLYTGLTLDQAVKGEYAVHARNLVPTSYSGEWVCSVCGTKLYDSGWYCASEKAIEYYMDSRNFLDETNVFQFLDLNTYASDSVSLEGIQSKVNGSFLKNYANDINNACKNTNVNPYYVIARLIQEQGYSGTRIGTGMDGGDGKTYYNPFNIGASGNGSSTIYTNALATAKSYGWDSMQKAIEGGISFLKDNWLENYQNTLYQNKFDIDSTNGTALYQHQYMQNLMGAYSEAQTLKSMYSNTGKINSSFIFIIPVYEKTSATSTAKPTNNSETNPINVQVTANGGLNIRTDASTNSSVIKTVAQGEVILSVQRGINSNWQKVVLNDGTIGYMSGTYLQQVGDVTNCNYTAYIKTADGSGCNTRIGPSTSLDKVTALAEGTYVTVINEGTYNNIDGYNWVRILLPDGRQAFMPVNYLKR